MDLANLGSNLCNGPSLTSQAAHLLFFDRRSPPDLSQPQTLGPGKPSPLEKLDADTSATIGHVPDTSTNWTHRHRVSSEVCSRYFHPTVSLSLSLFLESPLWPPYPDLQVLLARLLSKALFAGWNGPFSVNTLCYVLYHKNWFDKNVYGFSKIC